MEIKYKKYIYNKVAYILLRPIVNAFIIHKHNSILKNMLRMMILKLFMKICFREIMLKCWIIMLLESC